MHADAHLQPGVTPTPPESTPRSTSHALSQCRLSLQRTLCGCRLPAPTRRKQLPAIRSSSGPDEERPARNKSALTKTCQARFREGHGRMLPWLRLRHGALHLGQAVAPVMSPGRGRQMTMNGGWAFHNAGLWQRGRRTASARAQAAAPAQPVVYQITETTQLLLQRGDITLFEGDAIVNAGACTPRFMYATIQKAHFLSAAGYTILWHSAVQCL